MKPTLQIKNLGKTFYCPRGGRHRSLKHLLSRLWSRETWRTDQLNYVTVLENISFDVYPGEFVGIMGRNGIGKSTILKIIAGIYQPSTGSIEANGSIAPLLDLGAGFQDDLSGYENIFLNAAILGFSREETMEQLENIIRFTELGPKLYQPVRTYSMGMLVRLGFSIAAYMNSPIVLLDEVLGVGDAGFLLKSTRKIKDLHEQGRTIILVTHNPVSVSNHCTRCIVLDQKKIIFDGDAKTGANVYLQSVCEPTTEPSDTIVHTQLVY